ncbi:MFS transporter [Veillonella parvula]|uniref:MFS transporter n=1 Tax=Veillonella parvula TaxID=29466 RepID=UPI001D08AC77|nr:MFS transporter [Veillonella parvula]MCB7450761.1 MFS transporter [Veillonella parvula]MCQ4955928.1 MFS transporter [Veillonella parvula]MCQ4977070.1 MFS transporter [Veillonella parvula]
MSTSVYDARGGMRNVWIITASMTVLAICYTMIIPFLPIYLLELGVSKDDVALWSGLVFGITFLIAGIMAPIWGKIADNKGKKRMALRAGFAIAVSYVLIGMVTDQYQLLMGRALVGFANGFYPAAMTMVSLSVDEKQVGRALGIFQTGLILGNVIGPFLGGAVESVVGMRPVFYISGIAVFIATLAVLFLVKEPKLEVENTTSKEQSKQPVKTTSLREDFKSVQEQHVLIRLLWIYFFMQCVIMMLQPILALYVGDMQGTMEGAAIISGTILSIGGLAGSLTTNIWVRIGERRGYFRTISYCMLGSGVVLLLQSLPVGIWWFGVLQVLIGSCIVGINPSLSAAVTLNTEPGFRGRMFGMTTTAQQFGSMVGPVFASIVSTYIGISYVFSITGLLLLYMGFQSRKLSVQHDKYSV